MALWRPVYDPFYYDPWVCSPRALQLFDQDFGMGLFDEDLLKLPSRINRQVRQLLGTPESGMSKIINDDKQFQVHLDVKHFKPEELHVKLVDDFISIEGKHEEVQDKHGSISRHFVRKYAIPKGVKLEEMTSALTDDGVLTIKAPKIPKEALPSNERVIPIENIQQAKK